VHENKNKRRFKQPKSLLLVSQYAASYRVGQKTGQYLIVDNLAPPYNYAEFVTVVQRHILCVHGGICRPQRWVSA